MKQDCTRWETAVAILRHGLCWDVDEKTAYTAMGEIKRLESPGRIVARVPTENDWWKIRDLLDYADRAHERLLKDYKSSFIDSHVRSFRIDGRRIFESLSRNLANGKPHLEDSLVANLEEASKRYQRTLSMQEVLEMRIHLEDGPQYTGNSMLQMPNENRLQRDLLNAEQDALESALASDDDPGGEVAREVFRRRTSVRSLKAAVERARCTNERHFAYPLIAAIQAILSQQHGSIESIGNTLFEPIEAPLGSMIYRAFQCFTVPRDVFEIVPFTKKVEAPLNE